MGEKRRRELEAQRLGIPFTAERRTDVGDNNKRVGQENHPEPPLGYVKCGECLFWVKATHPGAQADGGFCRAIPPLPFLFIDRNLLTGQQEQKVTAYYPPTHDWEWCGEGMPFVIDTIEMPEDQAKAEVPNEG